MTAKPPSISFDTTLMSAGNNTGIAVPAELLSKLGAGKRPPVDVELNGYRYRSTIGVMGGQSLVSPSGLSATRQSALRHPTISVPARHEG